MGKQDELTKLDKKELEDKRIALRNELSRVMVIQTAARDAVEIPKMRKKLAGKCFAHYWSDTKKTSYVRVIDVKSQMTAKTFQFDAPDIIRGVVDESIGFFKDWRKVSGGRFFLELKKVIATSQRNAHG